MTLLHILVLVLLICELRWRLMLLRLLLVGLVFFDLITAVQIAGARRRALAQTLPDSVSIPAASTSPSPEFERGVMAMSTEASENLGRVTFPALIFVWMAVSPLLLDGIARLRSGPKQNGLLEQAAPNDERSGPQRSP